MKLKKNLTTEWVKLDVGGPPARNNCVPKSIAVALGIPYASVLRQLDQIGIFYDYFYEPDYDGWNMKITDPGFMTVYGSPDKKIFGHFGFTYHKCEDGICVDDIPDSCVVVFPGHCVGKVKGKVYDARDPRYFDKKKMIPWDVTAYWSHPAAGETPASDC